MSSHLRRDSRCDPPTAGMGRTPCAMAYVACCADVLPGSPAECQRHRLGSNVGCYPGWLYIKARDNWTIPAIVGTTFHTLYFPPKLRNGVSLGGPHRGILVSFHSAMHILLQRCVFLPDCCYGFGHRAGNGWSSTDGGWTATSGTAALHSRGCRAAGPSGRNPSAHPAE
jgi:hypothetical protein